MSYPENPYQNGQPYNNGQYQNSQPYNNGQPQNGYNPHQQQPPKSNKKLILGLILGAVGFIALLIVGLVIFANVFFGSDGDRVMNPIAEHGNFPQDGVISLEEAVQVQDGALPAWAVPMLTTDGWTITAFDKNGINAFANSITGCAFISAQNDSLYTNSDAVDSIRVQAEYATAFVSSEATNVQSENIDSVEITKDIAGNSSSIEYLTSGITYLGNDNVDYRMTLAVRNYSNVPASTALIYVCPVSTYSEAEFTDIIGDTAMTFFRP